MRGGRLLFSSREGSVSSSLIDLKGGFLMYIFGVVVDCPIAAVFAA